jgi:hypothetical protein
VNAASVLGSRVVVLALITACVQTKTYRVVPAGEPLAMAPEAALGEWESSFGRVDIEPDNARGGLEAGAVRGTWTYWNPKVLRDVRGHFQGELRGTLLRLRFSEEQATGFGFLELSPGGDSFEGRWWNRERTQTGIWRGWRPDSGQVGI